MQKCNPQTLVDIVHMDVLEKGGGNIYDSFY